MGHTSQIRIGTFVGALASLAAAYLLTSGTPLAPTPAPTIASISSSLIPNHSVTQPSPSGESSGPPTSRPSEVGGCETTISFSIPRSLAFNNHLETTVGDTKPVKVVLANGPVAATEMPGSGPMIVTVETPCRVTSDLTAPGPSVAELVAQSPETQGFVGTGRLEWEWDVTPLLSKSIPLTLRVQPVFSVLVRGGLVDVSGSAKKFTITVTARAAPISPVTKVRQILGKILVNPFVLLLLGIPAALIAMRWDRHKKNGRSEQPKLIHASLASRTKALEFGEFARTVPVCPLRSLLPGNSVRPVAPERVRQAGRCRQGL